MLAERKRPGTPEEYVEMIRTALFEVEDLRAAIEYDNEGMSDSLVFIDELEHHIKALYKSLEDGTYEFEDKDLSYMQLVREHGLFSLPFRDLLTIINDTHRNGLQVNG